MKNIQRVAAIHDLSGYGKASLTIVIPTLSAMGIQVCPLPTALLSTHTGFEGFTFLDLTSEMEKIIEHWQKLNLRFDAIYTGFLGSPKQVGIVREFITEINHPDLFVVVDPVFGDNGKLYPTMDQTMVNNMKWLVQGADVITPNITELAFLLDKPYKKSVSLKEMKDWLRAAGALGPQYVVATSVPCDDDKSGSVVAFDRENNRFWRVRHSYIRAHFCGTGDTFTSVLLGSLLQGDNFPASIDRAVQFVHLAIQSTYGYGESEKDIVLEKVLHTLKNTAPSYSYEQI